MLIKSSYVRARMPDRLLKRIKHMADAEGLSVSEQTRRMLERESDVIATEDALKRIEEALARLSAPAIDLDRSVLVEILFLVRELAADRNAQILFRVNQKLDSQFGAQRGRT